MFDDSLHARGVAFTPERSALPEPSWREFRALDGIVMSIDLTPLGIQNETGTETYPGRAWSLEDASLLIWAHDDRWILFPVDLTALYEANRFGLPPRDATLGRELRGIEAADRIIRAGHYLPEPLQEYLWISPATGPSLGRRSTAEIPGKQAGRAEAPPPDINPDMVPTPSGIPAGLVAKTIEEHFPRSLAKQGLIRVLAGRKEGKAGLETIANRLYNAKASTKRQKASPRKLICRAVEALEGCDAALRIVWDRGKGTARLVAKDFDASPAT